MKLFLIFFLMPSFLLADTRILGFTDFSRYLVSKFNELKSNPPMTYESNAELVSRYQQQHPQFNPRDPYVPSSFSYEPIANAPAGDPRNYLINQTMLMLGTLATSLATTAGTQEAPNAATDLQGQAAQLSAVARELAPSDPTNSDTLQTTAANLNNEAAAIDSGDTSAATQDANNIAATPQTNVTPSYQPPAQSASFLSSVGSIVSGIVVSTVGLLDMGFAQALLSKVGLGSISGIIGTAGIQALNGVPASSMITNTGISAAGMGANSLQTQANPSLANAINPISAPAQAPSMGSANAIRVNPDNGIAPSVGH